MTGSREIKFQGATRPVLLPGGAASGRMVQTVKDLFRKSVGRALLNRDEFETVMIEVERVINSRPLTYDAEHPGDAKPLTLLQILNGAEPVEAPEDAADVVTTSTHTQLTQLDKEQQLQFRNWWTRWRREYLAELKFAEFGCYRRLSHDP